MCRHVSYNSYQAMVNVSYMYRHVSHNSISSKHVMCVDMSEIVVYQAMVNVLYKPIYLILYSLKAMVNIERVPTCLR